MIGDEVTVAGYAGSPNDVIWELFNGGTSTKIGQSDFHLSCSDVDMNGPEDCGKREGDAKAYSGFVNDWIFEGMAGNGLALDCTPPTDGSNCVSPPAEVCEISMPPPPHCTTKVRSLGLRYLAGSCGNSSNQQGSSASCSGSNPGTGAVSITVTGDGVSASPNSGIFQDDTTILTKGGSDLGKDTQFSVTGAGGTQSLKIRTDCSKPLNLGDRFGAFEVVSIERKDQGLVQLGGTIEYAYMITNNGPVAVTGVSVIDDVLGEAPGSPITTIQPNETVTLQTQAFVSQTTINKVTVTGTNGGTQCQAMDAAMVIVNRLCAIMSPFTSSDPRTSVVFNESEVLRTFRPVKNNWNLDGGDPVPQQCSTSTNISCTVNADCPTGQSCVVPTNEGYGGRGALERRRPHRLGADAGGAFLSARVHGPRWRSEQDGRRLWRELCGRDDPMTPAAALSVQLHRRL